MIYYFVFARPANERAELEWEKEKLQEKKEEEQQREKDLQNCLDIAKENDNRGWDAEVERLDSKDDALPINIAQSLKDGYAKRRDELIELFGPK